MQMNTEPREVTLLKQLARQGPCPSCGRPGQERIGCADCLAWTRLFLLNAEMKRLLKELEQ